MDPQVKPIAQPLRSVAIHLKDAVTKELLKQVEEGILEKVKMNSAPTPWISNLVVVNKEKGQQGDLKNQTPKRDNRGSGLQREWGEMVLQVGYYQSVPSNSD